MYTDFKFLNKLCIRFHFSLENKKQEFKKSNSIFTTTCSSYGRINPQFTQFTTHQENLSSPHQRLYLGLYLPLAGHSKFSDIHKKPRSQKIVDHPHLRGGQVQAWGCSGGIVWYEMYVDFRPFKTHITEVQLIEKIHVKS